jgi:DHA1 family tetracycline resistance protein-like MFS transporter
VSELNPTRRRISLYPILSVNFVGSLGFSIVLPFLVFLVARLGGNALIYGVMGATYSFFQLVGAPLLGRWSDRYGRRRILLLSQLGTAVSWTIFLGALFLPVAPLLAVESGVLGTFTLTVPLAVLFIARALDGITGGNVSVANAYLADVSEESERSANFGKMAVSANLGFIVGPAIAGALGATRLGETLPVIAALAISVVATFIIILALPESQQCVLVVDPEQTNVRKVLGADQKECFLVKGAPKLSMVEILSFASIPKLLSLYFLVYLAFNLFYIAFPVYAVSALRWSLAQTGVFFSVMSLMMVVVQGPVLSRASRAASDRALVIGGSLVLAVSFVFFASRSTPVIYVGTALLALGNGVMWPSLMSIISKATDRDVQGAVQGFASSAGAVASMVGLLIGGLLYGYLESGVFILAAAITTFVFLMSMTLAWPQRPTEVAPQ